MGNTQTKNISIAVIIWGLIFVVIYLYTAVAQKSKKSDANISTNPNIIIEQNKTKTFNQLCELNRTLDSKYQSVALQIEAFIKRQRALKKEKNISVNSKNNKTIDEVNLTKVASKQSSIKEANKTIEKHNSKTKIKKKSPKDKKSSLPKLAIIMDDVGFKDDIEKIKKIPFAITPSIFPPTQHYPDTPSIAKKFKHHMIHIPMEAYKYKNMAEEAIKISDKIEIIDKKIKKIKHDFPRAIAINNHTGSKFTCDFDAMEQFFTVLNRYDFQFIDSRTSSGTQCKEAGKLLHKKVLERDIFLDNQANEEYIRSQLKEAVKIAKKNGKAIAICHPRDLTFKVLMSSKKLLKGVKLVYIDELM
jgi:polysaccharide deacetylase 2 family uncharacterized protein YibQ